MITKYINKGIVLSAAVFLLGSCTPDNAEGNGLEQGALDASFKVSKTSENHYLLKRNYNNYLNSRWNIDDDGYNNGKGEENIFLPDAGTYVIQHQAVGIGGTATETIVVPTSDPISGNMIQGGRFDTTDEIAKWNIHKISASGAQWVFANGKATIVASGGNQQAIIRQ